MAPVSQPDSAEHASHRCLDCGHSLSGNYLARQVCTDCGNPQPVSTSETFFTALGVDEKFSQDRDALQTRFYEVSRALHPDRFSTAGASAKQRSLERMSFVNDAYRTLRDPAALRDYILELHGMKSGEAARGQIPMELAESWFELQDALADDPGSASAKIGDFKNELQSFLDRVDERLKELERELDQKDALSGEYRQGLERLSREIHQMSYLKSLARDVERLGLRSGELK